MAEPCTTFTCRVVVRVGIATGADARAEEYGARTMLLLRLMVTALMRLMNAVCATPHTDFAFALARTETFSCDNLAKLGCAQRITR